MFFGTDFLCKCKPQPILKKISPGEYKSIVQNRTASDTEILLESFSDEDDDSCKKTDDIEDDKKNSSNDSSNDEKLSANNNNGSSPNNDAAEIRRLLRRKDELERKQKMQERYNERLQVSTKNVLCKFYVKS